MKIRLYRQHLRYRLTEGEVARWRREGVLVATTWIGPVPCQFSLRASEGLETQAISYAEQEWRVLLPAERMRAWADDPAAISLRLHFRTTDYPELLVLIEKDLGCKHEQAAPGEEAADPYPLPGTGNAAPGD